MADPNNIQADVPYRTAVAERGKFWQVDQDYLTSLGYPASGEGKYAILTYPINGSTATTSGGDIITLMGGIAESTIPTPVSDGEPVAQWFDVYGRPIIFGSNLSTNSIDVSVINDSNINRLGPLTNLTAIASAGAGVSVDVSNYHNFTIQIVSSSVTSGAFVDIEHSLDGTNFATIVSNEILSDGVVEIAISQQAYRYLRTTIPTYLDGTYTTYIYAGN